MNIIERAYKSFNYRTHDLQLHIAKRIINLDVNKNYYIFAEPRGGSTWIAEILQHALKKPILWEPFFNNKIEIINAAGFSERQFMRPDAQDAALLNVVNHCFQGRYLNDWLAQKASPLKLAFSNNAIIKVCKGNGILPWLLNNIEFYYKPIYLVRNPFAVVSSQMKHRGWGDEHLRIQMPEQKHNEIYKENYNFLKSLNKKEKVLAAYWCIANKELLSGRYDDKIIRINYEDVIIQTSEFLSRIKDEWNLKFNLNESLQVFRNPSSTASIDFQKDPYDQIHKWRSQLNPEEVKGIKEVCEYFEIDIHKWYN